MDDREETQEGKGEEGDEAGDVNRSGCWSPVLCTLRRLGTIWGGWQTKDFKQHLTCPLTAKKQPLSLSSDC